MMSSPAAATGTGTPWYRHFWPWFIVALLGVSVAGSLVTVAIAYHYRDVDVRIAAPPDPARDPAPIASGSGR